MRSASRPGTPVGVPGIPFFSFRLVIIIVFEATVVQCFPMPWYNEYLSFRRGITMSILGGQLGGLEKFEATRRR